VSDIQRNCEARQYTRTLFFHEDGVSRLFQAYPIDGYAEGALLCLINGELVTPAAFEKALDPLGFTIDKIVENASRYYEPVTKPQLAPVGRVSSGGRVNTGRLLVTNPRELGLRRGSSVRSVDTRRFNFSHQLGTMWIYVISSGSGVEALQIAGKILIATSRSSRGSRAWYTSPFRPDR